MKTLIVLIALLPLSANAGTIYKCKNAKGVASYSQVPCQSAKQAVGTRQFAEVANSPKVNYSRQSGYQKISLGSSPQQNYATSSPSQSNYARDEANRRAENDATSSTWINRGRNQPSNSGRTATSTQSGPTTSTDQNGRTYTTPQGSSFATDNQTGKQCFVNGAFIHC